MRKHSFILFLLIGLFGCDVPTELPVFENVKPADNFSRAFIGKIISGEIENAFVDIEPEKLDSQARKFITNASRNINGAKPKKYKVVEMNYTSVSSTTTDKFTNYRLGYEYEFEKGYILFTTTIKETDGKFLISAFNGEFLTAPLSELTKFTLTEKSVLHYAFLVLCILVPLFILVTLITMLFSKMTVKKKVIWALIILLISLPRFTINWGNGQFDFNLIHFSLLASGFGKPTLYSAWILNFHLPIGSIIFWFKRKSLLPEKTQENNGTFNSIDTTSTDETANE